MRLLWLGLGGLSVSALIALTALFLISPGYWREVGRGWQGAARYSAASYKPPFLKSAVALSAGERLLIGGSCMLALAAPAIYLELPWLLLPAFAMVILAPEAYVAYLSARDQARIEAQVPRAIAALCRALRTGINLYNGLALAAEDVDPPLKHHIQKVLDRFAVTGDMAGALDGVRQEARSRRLNALLDVLVFDLQEGVAGTAGEVDRLEAILESQRQKEAIRRELATKTAGTRFNLRLVSLTIPGTVLLVVFTDGSLLTPLLTQPLGRISLAVSVIGYLGTFYVSRKWSRVEL